RLVDAARQVAADARDRVAHVVHGAVDVLAEDELDRRCRGTVLGVGHDVHHVADGGDGVLDNPRHVGFHFRRRRAGIGHGDRDVRNVDVGELVDAELLEPEHPREGQQDEKDDRGDRLAGGFCGDVLDHDLLPLEPSATVGEMRTRSPSFTKPAPAATTRASAFNPELTSTRPFWRAPVSILVWCAMPSAPTTNTYG